MQPYFARFPQPFDSGFTCGRSGGGTCGHSGGGTCGHGGGGTFGGGFCGGGACSGCSACVPAPGRSYTGEEWAEWVQTPEGQNLYRWWADWIPTPEGQSWCANKRLEARCVVRGMIQQWGLQTLRAGEGVFDIGGDPGFVAAELLSAGIHATVVDPAYGLAGKSDPWTSAYLQDNRHWHHVRPGVEPFRIIRQPFDEAFVSDPENAKLLQGASAMVALYPDEGTDFVLRFSASKSKRTALIPCNECWQYFPSHEPTYEGFVKQLLLKDRQHCRHYGQRALLRREQIWGTPYCQCLLQRSPAAGTEGYQ